MKGFDNKEIRCKSSLKNFHLIESFIDDLSDFYHINNTYYGNILIAISEAFENAVMHGNKNDENKYISFEFQNAPYGFNFVITDEGNGFEYHKIPTLNDFFETSNNENNGFFLIKTLSDDIEFNEKGNQIKLIFKIASINKELSIDRINSLNEYNSEIHKLNQIKKSK